MERIPEVKLDGLYVEITDRCNLRCNYCCRSCGAENSNNMSIALLEEMMKAAIKMGLNNLAISGGEALLHPQIKDIVRLVKRYTQNYTVLTNGTLLSGIEEDFLHEIENIQISLDSGDRETNDAMRGDGTYDHIQEGIEDILRKGYSPERISLKMVITSNNYNHVKQLAHFADKYGIQSIGYSFVYKEGRANDIEDVFLNDEQKIKVMEVMEEMYKIFPKISIDSPGYTEICPLLNEEEIKLTPRIDVNGNVYACQMFDEKFVLGNMNSQSLWDILHSGKLYSLHQLLIGRKDFMRKCHSCFAKGMCGRGCPGVALYENDFLATDGMCCLRKKHRVDYLKHSLAH